MTDEPVLTFEQARDELEQVVMQLEDGATSLDQAIGLWERGEALYRICRERLEAAEQRIERLSVALGEQRAQDEGIGPT
jgi:exodeoxyribonuclease VII small subunit